MNKLAVMTLALALSWFATQGSAAEDAAAAMQTAYQLHRQGKTQQALAIWQRLAQRGDSDAAYNLAVVHHHADGVPYDPVQALAWYRVAAERGDREAQFMLGLMYQRGEGAPADAERAHEWFTKHRREHRHHHHTPQFLKWQREARALIEEHERREAYAASRHAAADVIAALRQRAGMTQVAPGAVALAATQQESAASQREQ